MSSDEDPRAEDARRTTQASPEPDPTQGSFRGDVLSSQPSDRSSGGGKHRRAATDQTAWVDPPKRRGQRPR